MEILWNIIKLSKLINVFLQIFKARKMKCSRMARFIRNDFRVKAHQSFSDIYVISL